jgi:coenzyme PQQ synthesis protein D (PqqD)
VRLADHVVARRFGSETVLLNLQTGHYHGLDALGSDFLTALTEGRDVETAAAVLAERFGVAAPQVRGDLAAFCQDLGKRGLIAVDDDAGS